VDTGLTGKVALVTGGNNPHGIGAAAARAFAAEGAAVFIHYFSRWAESLGSPSGEGAATEPSVSYYLAMQKRSAEQVATEIREAGGRAGTWECNLANPDTVPELFDRAERECGIVDVLVNNAAEYQSDTFEPIEPADVVEHPVFEEGLKMLTVTAASHDRHFAVNSRATALMMAEFARRKQKVHGDWGRIINVSGDAARGGPNDVSYWASKHALESYSRAAAAELGHHGITVNVVSPGPVQTGYISKELETELIGDIALGRVGQPEDIAGTIVFLASEQANWITGQVIQVHGGHRLLRG
jgi:3-oxoacyl-[acyl-carrier protein] reductase